MKEFLGTHYFTPYVDAEQQLRSKFEGKVVAFIVRRDDGSEFEIRKQHTVFPNMGIPLKRTELSKVQVGEKLAYLQDSVPTMTVRKVYADEGQIWIANEQTGKQTVVKYHELKRVGG